MFESSTFHSSNLIRSRTPQWMLATCTLNLIAIGALILLPLAYPDGLPSRMLQSVIFTPPPPSSSALAKAVGSNKAFHQTRPELALLLARPSLPVIADGATIDSEPQPPGNLFDLNSSSRGIPGSSETWKLFPASAFPQVIHPPAPKTLKISDGVAQGMLLIKTNPAYPEIAKAAGVSGTVVLLATISKAGTIENIRILSGNPMLQSAAIQAVQTWRYRPYLLNGQPVEVETNIHIVFSMGDRQ